MLAALKNYWAKHAQKTLGGLIILLSGADLATLTAYQQDLSHFIGPQWTAHVLAATRLICGLAIVLRALQAKINANPN